MTTRIASPGISPLLLSDPAVAATPVHECGERLVRLPPDLGPGRARVREGLAARLQRAHSSLPGGVGLLVVEGYRSLADQRAIVERYTAEVRAGHPGADEAEVRRLTSRFVAPVAVAPHVAGAAVDLTLVDASGAQLDLGTPIDATPEESAGACYTGAAGITSSARAMRDLLGTALGGAGLVNYPTEWWHWSFGDRYWALTTGAPAAIYGPVEASA